MRRRVALLGAGVVVALSAALLLPRAARRAASRRLLDALAAVPLGAPLDSVRAALPSLYCSGMMHGMHGDPAGHEQMCAADADGRDVNVTARDGRLAAITVVAFRRDMADVTAWARSRFGAPAGACTGDRGPMEWWVAGNRIVTVTRPVAGARSRELVIRPGPACPG